VAIAHSWIEPPPPVRVLLYCGWLKADEAADPRVHVSTISSSHTVHRVTTPDGRAVVVKQVPRKAAAAGRSLERELYVYRLAGWIPALRAILPRSFHIDEARELLVIESRADGDAWPPATDPIGAPGVAAGLGRAMARWQRATHAIALWPSIAVGILELPDALEGASVDRSAAACALMRAIAEDAELAPAMREGRASWRASCLIHGDLRRDNWIMRRRKRSVTFRMIDWELSGAGDPAWDVGSALAETALDAAALEGRVVARGGLRRHVRALRELLCAYRANRGPLDLTEAASADRVVLYAACRLLHVAIEWADAQDDESPFPGVILEASRLLLRSRARLARAIARWSRP
jgi:hypothetical protein